MTSFRKKFTKYWALFEVSIRTQIAYPWNALFQTLPALLRVWILAEVYSLMNKPGSLSLIEGVSTHQIIWSVGLTQIVGMAAINVDQTIQNEVRDGSIAYFLGRPINYLSYHYLGYIGRASSILFIGAMLGIPMIWILTGLISVNFEQIIWMFLLLAIGLMIYFLQSTAIGLCSFWIEDTSPMRWIYQKTWIALGGVLIPIAVLPDWLKVVVNLTPFPYLFQNGVSLVANFDRSLAISGLIGALSWLTISLLIVFFLYQRSLSRVAVNGG